MYCIPNTEVDHLCHHTQPHLKSIRKIPIIYQILRSQDSKKRNQLYGDEETLASNIDNLIIDTISYIRQPISDIFHFEAFKDPEFQNLLDFLDGDYAFFDFLETQVGGFGPPDPPKTHPPLYSIPSP